MSTRHSKCIINIPPVYRSWLRELQYGCIVYYESRILIRERREDIQNLHHYLDVEWLEGG